MFKIALATIATLALTASQVDAKTFTGHAAMNKAKYE